MFAYLVLALAITCTIIPADAHKISRRAADLYTPLAAVAPVECPMWANIRSFLSSGEVSTTPSPFDCPFLIKIVGNL